MLCTSEAKVCGNYLYEGNGWPTNQYCDKLFAIEDTLKGFALGKAVTYARNQRPYMENYPLDGRFSLSNNAAENAIRPFAVGGKNWLFADNPKGAKASAAVYSLVEAAKANGLNVYAYLQHLLQYMQESEWQRYPEKLDALIPWGPDVQEHCR